MTRSLSFLAGAASMLIAQALFFWVAHQAIPEPAAVDPTPSLERRFVFKMLAPKGYEDVGYVHFDCRPSIAKTRLLNAGKDGLNR